MNTNGSNTKGSNTKGSNTKGSNTKGSSTKGSNTNGLIPFYLSNIMRVECTRITLFMDRLPMHVSYTT